MNEISTTGGHSNLNQQDCPPSCFSGHATGFVFVIGEDKNNRYTYDEIKGALDENFIPKWWF